MRGQLNPEEKEDFLVIDMIAGPGYSVDDRKGKEFSECIENLRAKKMNKNTRNILKTETDNFLRYKVHKNTLQKEVDARS
jgi:hypothetical protein